MKLTPKPLTTEAFAVFGDVIDTESASNHFKINYGLTTRFHDLANVDVEESGGKAGVSIFEAQAAQLPHTVKVMENHPFGSQLFYPLSQRQFLVLVAPPSEKVELNKLELFLTNGKQGVNYHKGVWHHYLLPLEETSEFIVVDRIANDNNCIEEEFSLQVIIDS